jgi:NADH-quinone oxidoreductase subunit G
LLPGGRLVEDAAARAEVAAVWGEVPATPGRDIAGILKAVAEGALGGLVVGAVDPADTPDPAWAAAALENAGFVLSLELRHSAVTAHADVVLPVAPVAEKAGRFVNWEGRRRPFDSTITGTGALSDFRVLDALAEEVDEPIGLSSLDAVRAEIAGLGVTATRPAAPSVKVPAPVTSDAGQAVLATWAELIDAGRGQDGDEHLAGTATRVVAHLSPATAESVGIAEGELVTVSNERGAITAPASIIPMADAVVWLPTNARGSAVRGVLAAWSGDAVSVARAADGATAGTQAHPFELVLVRVDEQDATSDGGAA